MANGVKHLAQFEKNESVAERLAAAADYDWAVTALFYAGLHLVQAYLLQSGVFVHSHRDREREMRKARELMDVLDSYKVLQAHSEDARYECQPFSAAEYEAVRSGRYAVVADHINLLIRRSQ